MDSGEDYIYREPFWYW